MLIEIERPRAETTAQQPWTHLDALEAEAIFILREVASECRNVALLFSGGKDSAVVLRLAERAFFPERVPFTLLHVDTEHNFPEVIAFRDRLVAERGVAADRLDAGHGRALLALDRPEDQVALGREAARKGLSVREVEARVEIARRGRGGQIRVLFAGEAELNRLFELLLRAGRGRLVLGSPEC